MVGINNREKQKKSNEFLGFLQTRFGIEYFHQHQFTYIPDIDESLGDVKMSDLNGSSINVELTSIFHNCDLKISRAKFNNLLKREIMDTIYADLMSRGISADLEIITQNGVLELGKEDRNAILEFVKKSIESFTLPNKIGYSKSEYTVSLFLTFQENDINFRCHIYQYDQLDKLILLTPPDNDLIFNDGSRFRTHIQSIVNMKSDQLRKESAPAYLVIMSEVNEINLYLLENVLEDSLSEKINLGKFDEVYMFGHSTSYGIRNRSFHTLIDIKAKRFIQWDTDSDGNFIITADEHIN